MESNDKTAEEPKTAIINLNDCVGGVIVNQLTEAKEIIRDLLPLAEIGLTWHPRKAVVIDRAKKLLDK